MGKPKTVVEAVDEKGYVPTPREKEALESFDRRRKARRVFPRLKAKTDEKGVAQISSEHSDELVAQAMQNDALGLADPGQFNSLLRGILNFTTDRNHKVDIDSANEALQLVVGMEPQNPTEAMLATQMAAVHLAAMDAARRMHRTPIDIDVVAVNAKVLNNLMRTFALQAEAMKKLKGGGQQKVVVEHKHYYLAPGSISNSNAVLGDVSQGRGTNEISHQPQERERDLPERATVHGQGEGFGLPMSGAGSEWLEGVSLPWSQERRPNRVS